MSRRGWMVGLAVVFALTAACGGDSSESSSDGSSDTSEAVSTTSATDATDTTDPATPDESTTTLPPGQTPGLDDLDQDGEPDPVCSTQDYGAGLVLRVQCNAAGYASTPEEGVTLVPNSMAGVQGLEVDLTGVSGNAIQARDNSGKKVVVLFITSDTLFDVGSAELSEPAVDNFDGLARVIQANWSTSSVQVRGHTDATGSAAANQTLSEQRAAVVVDHLAARGIDRSRLSSVGLASTVPLALETNPDGSDNPLGRQQNRRVELVVRIP